jgi:hypothetical protein
MESLHNGMKQHHDMVTEHAVTSYGNIASEMMVDW